MVRIELYSFKFNEIIPFDKWKTTVLTKIKSFIPEEGATAPKNTDVEVDVELWYAYAELLLIMLCL